MARDAPELIACEECGSLNERATALLDQAKLHIDNLERDLRAKRAKITRLETERKDALIASRYYEDAMVVLRYWSEKLMPNAREIDSTDRLEAVIARLKGKYTVEDLRQCVDGYVKKPYVTREGRSPYGTPAERKVDPSLIFGTPKHVENGIAYAASPASGRPNGGWNGSIESVPWRRAWDANRRLLMRALEKEGGPGVEHPSGYLLFRCPKCWTEEDESADRLGLPYLSLLVARDPRSGWLAECQRCGINDARLIAAITKDKET